MPAAVDEHRTRREQYHGAIAACDAGNANVQTHVVAGYAHSDILIGRSVRTEVWPLLIH